MMDAVITFDAAHGSLKFYTVDEALEFIDVQGYSFPDGFSRQEVLEKVWWRVALKRGDAYVGQLELTP